MNKKDIIASLFLLGLSVLFWIQSKTFTKYGALFPQTVIIILGFLSSILLISAIVKIIKGNYGATRVEKIQDIKSIIISIVLIAAWAFFIKILGFLTSSIIFFLAMFLLLVKKDVKLKRIIINVVAILISITVFYLFFSKVLQVPFPTGIFI